MNTRFDMNEPILTSMLDDDLYKINMGSVAFHTFSRAIVTYEFFNRGKTPFPEGFDVALRIQIKLMSGMRLTAAEAAWMKTISYIRPTYVEWFSGYQLDPGEVFVVQHGSDLRIRIRGPWYRTIFWEVKLMAVISELYFKMTGQYPCGDWEDRIVEKARTLGYNGCHWIDFGTRRRFSGKVQEAVVRNMVNFKGLFLGTSNPYLAFKFGVTPHGTYAHESVMAMSALYGVRMANKMWMKHWSEHFDGNVGVALTDTFTTDAFLRDFGTYEGRLFDGVRQDSNDPNWWADEKILPHYRKLGIATNNKRLVFSDALKVGPPEQPKISNSHNYVALDIKYRGIAQPVGGIGTFFTNDVGVKPLNMVIKMTKADFGFGEIDVVKLSDDLGKSTGTSQTVEHVKAELGIK